MSKGYCQISLADLAPDAIDGCNRAALSELFGSQRVQPVLAFDRTAFHTEQPLLARGMSISGVQPKLSVTLDKQQRLIHTEKSGQFILKPSPEAFPHLAENEHATMLAVKQLLPAASAGLVRFAGDHREFVYLVRRFDRSADGQKIHQEQLDAAMGIKDKYGMEGGHPCVSYARAGQFIHQHLGFVATQSYYQMVVLAYLLCNNDLHLRNFGIIHKPKGSVLAPVYDFVNTVPYKAVFHSSYLALPLLLEEEGENGELAPGFDGPPRLLCGQ